MNKKQAARYVHLVAALASHGFTMDETNTLLRLSRSLHRWGEAECNGDIQRDEASGKPFRVYGQQSRSYLRVATPDRETSALNRAKALCESHGLSVYHQSDPRGCALYVLRPGDVPKGADVGSCYSRGIAVCID